MKEVMRKKACKKVLIICVIASVLWLRCAAQQTWLGCEAANIMAAVTALGVTYRVGQNVVYSALASGPHWSNAEEDRLVSCAIYRGWLPCNMFFGWYGKTSSLPTHKGVISADIVLRGFWPALAMGTLTAVAARSYSLPQLEMKDAIKPVACMFGTLFAVGTVSAILRSNRSVVKNMVNAPIGAFDLSNVFRWEQCLVDYGTYVGMACIPLYVYYQRYKV